MGRERRNFKRESFIREVQKLFVIATEGEKTEVKYFEAFKSEEYYSNQKIYVEVLKRIDSGSSPSNVVRQLTAFAKEYNIKSTDELWMVIDRDMQSWTPAEIASVARICAQKGFGFALSNPCFEFWLLMHRVDPSTFSAQKAQSLLQNAKTGSRTQVELELITLCGSYNKTNLNVDDFLPHINVAIQRAESLILAPNERWPSNLGSHVYKLVSRLLP